jgi:coenzyme F420-reducing hydrogenase gamma subunit
MAKIAAEWLNICGGCEVSILDIGEPLLDLLPQLEFVHIPVLADPKYFGQTGERANMEIPAADVGIVSGGVRNEKEKQVAQEMRAVQDDVALGSCAVRRDRSQQRPGGELQEKVFRGSKTAGRLPTRPGTCRRSSTGSTRSTR